jgi:hypothetical protein
MSSKQNLADAMKKRDDEFYTRLGDISKEMEHYTDHFKDKVVLCNCDDPNWSNFTKYFRENFKRLGLRGLISMGLNTRVEVLGTKEGLRIFQLKDNGDFRSQEAQWYLSQADIVVTNPPFSLFKEYVKQLLDANKKFLVVAHETAVIYKTFFPAIRDERVWMGYTKPKLFSTPDKGIQKFGNICWFTNLDTNKRHTPIPLTETFDSKRYPRFDNLNAVNIDRVKNIPHDYYENMGVPVTYVGKHCPEQFQIVDIDINVSTNGRRAMVLGKEIFTRIIIKRRGQDNAESSSKTSKAVQQSCRSKRS